MSDLGNREVLAKNLQYYMDLNGKSRSDICDALGIKYTTFTDWVKGNTYPRIDKIELLANYFGVQKADLIEDKSVQRLRKSVDFGAIIEKAGIEIYLAGDDDSFEGPLGYVVTLDHKEYRYIKPKEADALYSSILSFLRFQIENNFMNWEKTDGPEDNK